MIANAGQGVAKIIMTKYQRQVLEELYKASGEQSNVMIDIRDAQVSVDRRTVGPLFKQGLIQLEGRWRFAVTPAGAAKALGNRRRAAR